jgi:N-acetyl sugar amidotransferase
VIRYCTRCLLPETKPDLWFDDDGVCAACVTFDARSEVDWSERLQSLNEIVARYRSPSRWDCIVPVSGGKDSTWQVLQVLQLGLNPLCVTATTCHLSELGRRNIRNIQNLGVDHIQFSPNPRVRASLNRIGLRYVGDISWAEHVGIFTIPVQAAVAYEIPLIVWGENSQNEYGGPASDANSPVLDRAWLEEFGGLLGLRVADVLGIDGLTERDMAPYVYPTDEALARVGVTGVFLGHYLPWDGLTNAIVATAHGFNSLDHSVEGSMVGYENLDNYQTGIHDYFKYLKFGYGRATDIASLHVRRGRLSRLTALEIVRRNDGQFPWTYLDLPLDQILSRIGMAIDEFVEICDQFTNRDLFQINAAGQVIKRDDGSPLKINDDNG